MTDDYSDLTELGIDINEGDALSLKFDKCVRHIQSIAGSLDNETLLKLYGFYKQSIEGMCNTAKPSWYDMKGKAKWEAWKSLGNLDQNDAKNKYIELVMTICPEFSFDEAGNKPDSWVKVSSMVEEYAPLEKGICEYIRNGDTKSVLEYLKTHASSINLRDDSGIGLIHYAADIGNEKMLELLINQGSNINLQDSEGQTALHYAASCGHIDCIKFLLTKGAGLEIKDSDNCTAREVACDDSVRALLK